MLERRTSSGCSLAEELGRLRVRAQGIRSCSGDSFPLLGVERPDSMEVDRTEGDDVVAPLLAEEPPLDDAAVSSMLM